MWIKISNTQPLLSISVWAQVMFSLWIGNETQSLSPLGLWFKCSLGRWWLNTKRRGSFCPISPSPCQKTAENSRSEWSQSLSSYYELLFFTCYAILWSLETSAKRGALYAGYCENTRSSTYLQTRDRVGNGWKRKAGTKKRSDLCGGQQQCPEQSPRFLTTSHCFLLRQSPRVKQWREMCPWTSTF